MKNAGERLVELLEAYGVELIFGIPGAHNLEMYRGLAASSIRHVLARHEQGAAFAADGYARVAGRPGVCFLITGPGVANATAAIGQAYSDSVPMLVISSACDRDTLGKGPVSLGRGFLHECRDQTLLTAGVTAWSVMAQTADDIPHAIAKAFALFAQERPRPVHLSIPMDVLKEPVAEPWSPVPPPEKHTAGPQAISAAVHHLAAATKPLIIVGGGAVGAAPEIRALAERTGALVASTVAGKGILPADHPHNVGSILCLKEGWALAEAADLVIAIGTELAETDFWRASLPIKAPIIRMDIDPTKIADSYPAAVGLIGDAAPDLRALLAEIETQKLPHRAAWEPPFTKADMRSALAPLQQTHELVWQTVTAAIPADTIITADMTQLGYSGNYLMPRSRPNQWLHPTGFGTLGYALPAAIGAALGSGQPVLCVIGDAGLLFTVAELATAVEEICSPLVILLWNNSALGEIRDNMVDAGISPVGVIARNPDYIALARAFGCVGIAPTSLAGLHAALAQAITRPGVTLIEMTPEAVN